MENYQNRSVRDAHNKNWENAKEVGTLGAGKIRLETDLSLLRDMLSREDFAVFIRRFEANLSNRELAEDLGWTEDKLNKFLKGYQKRLSRLLGFSPCRR